MCDARFLAAGAVLLLAVSAVTPAAVPNCESVKCRGPVKWYESIGCKPVFENPGDCCAIRYDCVDVFKRSDSKCYANGHEYAIGDNLREEDANPCDIGCVCNKNPDGTASFNCAVVDCFDGPQKPGCYRRRSPLECCAGEEVCLEKEEDRPKCVVNGKTYLDGEYFPVPEDAELSCYCAPGYEGKNVAPFCAKSKRSYCDPYFTDADSIRQRCAPVFDASQSTDKDCSYSSRCQNSKDEVIHNHGELEPHDEHEHRVCTFGNLTMHLGDDLTQATDYSSVCVACICEVPPTPTCQRLPDNECDVSVHPPFDN